MMLKIVFASTLITIVVTQEIPKIQDSKPKENEQTKQPLVYLRTQLSEIQKQNEIEDPTDWKQLNSGPHFSPELYRLTYLEPQYHAEGALPRIQPQIVLYGPGGQGQQFLISPGNPPGNFLFPQGPGPNVIVRNNAPPGTVYPVAGYPKPAHIPPIEKDAEEIPTNPANIPPLPSNAKPVTTTRAKPEKIETLNEPNQYNENINSIKGQLLQFSPQTESLQREQGIFLLNGDNIFNYQFEPLQSDLSAFPYSNVQPFPQNPPKFLQTYDQEAPLESTTMVTVPKLSDGNLQQPESQLQQSQTGQPNHVENDALKTAQQYFRKAFPVNQPTFSLYPVNRHSLNQNIQEIENVPAISSKDEIVQPQVVGQFRFTPSPVPGLLYFKDDFENDAIVIDAVDSPGNFDQRRGNLKAEEIESSTNQPKPPQKGSEPSMAQAGPQATAIAGPGGVAGSAPRGTAIVGKGGLAISSPQATAVAGNKEEDKKKRPLPKSA